MKRNSVKISSKDLKKIVSEYQFDKESIEYDDKQLALFDALDCLSDGDRIILYLYAHFQSERKLAELLNVSRTSIRKCIKKIREQIKQEL